jgi:hypothetical protein
MLHFIVSLQICVFDFSLASNRGFDLIRTSYFRKGNEMSRFEHPMSLLAIWMSYAGGILVLPAGVAGHCDRATRQHVSATRQADYRAAASSLILRSSSRGRSGNKLTKARSKGAWQEVRCAAGKSNRVDPEGKKTWEI